MTTVVLTEHAYGEWRDETHAWHVKKVEDVDAYTVSGPKHPSQEVPSLDEALQLLGSWMGAGITLQMEKYSYGR
jgi:hypothetical protein